MAESEITGTTESVETAVKPNKSGDENVIAAVSYLLGWLSGIVVYLLYKDKSKFVSFHAVQSIIVFAGMNLLIMVLSVTIVGLVVVPFIMLASLVLWVWLMYMAYKGERYRLPYVGDMAEKYV
jgi:uncharacterized membrane protein